MRYFAAIFILFIALPASAQTLTVHEWGTFTTLRGSDGSVLSGLYIEEEQLPPFVYHHPGFSPDPIIQTHGYRPVKDVTVKMETPVLYFYSPKEQNIKVHVDFPNGTISQWYPERSGGEITPTSDTIDLSKPMTGSIDWDATVLAPDTKESITNNAATPKWYQPRETTSNLIKNHSGEIEKFLFYRGLANFSLPLEVKFLDSMNLYVKNQSEWDIPFIYIYDHISNTTMEGIWGIGPLKAGEARTYPMPQKYYYEGQQNPANDSFRVALENAGLTHLEAVAMLNTWSNGYFMTNGFKIFWIVPHELTDKILPLAITPTPDSVERVLVGKSEILTPSFELHMMEDYKSGSMDKWNNHYYYHAFMQRIGQLTQSSVKATSSYSHYTLAPNPATNYTHIYYANESTEMTVSVRNPLGIEVMNRVTSGALDIHSLASGMYFVTTTANGKSETLKLIKE